MKNLWVFLFMVFSHSVHAMNFHQPTPNNPKAYVFFAHGLNQKGDSYKNLYQYFYENNYAVVAPVIPGHETYKNFGKIEDQLLIEKFDEVFRFIQKENLKGLPIYFFGHSFGALVYLNYLNSYEPPAHKTLLLAPAIKIKYEKLLPLIPACLGIPSLAPKKYRAHSFTPGRAYHQLLRLKENIETELPLPESAVVYISPKDELVHYKNTKVLIPQANTYTSDAKLPKHYLFLPLTTEKDIQELSKFFK